MFSIFVLYYKFQSAIATVKGRSECRAIMRENANVNRILWEPGVTSAKRVYITSQYAKVREGDSNLFIF